MAYQQAGCIAILRRLVGWVVFTPALISALVSVLKPMHAHSEKQEGINAVMLDFAHVMINMMRVDTPFLNVLWYNPPTPDFQSGLNLVFWLIFILIFIGLASQDSGTRTSRQACFLREGVEDQLILEQAKGSERVSCEQLESRIVVPHRTVFLQVFPLYILPVAVIVIGYFFFSLLGFS